jgi:hypothetical protein
MKPIDLANKCEFCSNELGWVKYVCKKDNWLYGDNPCTIDDYQKCKLHETKIPPKPKAEIDY